MDLPASFNTVHRRTQLAQLLYERAKEQLNVCERLVHDQHLQQQGWSAVVASLEDITVELKKRAESFKLVFVDYLQKREFFVEISRRFYTINYCDVKIINRGTLVFRKISTC